MSHKTTLTTLAAIFAVVLLATAAWFWSQRGTPELVPPPNAAASAPPVDSVAEAASAIQPPASADAGPTALFPVEPAASETRQSAAGFDFAGVWAGLIGADAVKQFLETSEFPRRFVATVDNLGRSQAPPSVWPIKPTAGRFLIDDHDGKVVINATNAERYDALVRLIGTVDLHQAVRLYTQVYPMLQQAYQDIGYPKRYFNDRFVEVIDQLLATPEPTAPLQVHLTEVKGPLVSTRPWVRYEYVDPGYEQLAAGQKILLRMGPEHRRHLKARLIELRRELTRAPGPR